MSTSNLPGSFALVPRGNIREVVVQRILAAVIRGDFPVGHRMVIQNLAEQFGVSATPVREALVELASIGIVENLPNRGAVMREFGVTQIREIYQLRRILEVEAVRTSCGKIESRFLAELSDEFVSISNEKRNSNWSQKAMSLDIRLHSLIAAHCGSMRLQDELQRYNTLVQAIREVVDNESQAQEIALSDHTAIIAALQSQDCDKAAAEMEQHIRKTAEVVEKHMQERILNK
ncbi:GntR family transcriptional regulator [Gimesia algae]|uniref:HTH-type transcriptional regulator McbR n=1 Tax=Gimesia algae TaxID=2527971 RepID=A0A517V7L7_9PLAN|nr:GntR family transcriptional regulator [Gimesia algae]QDT88995.1 HTH-type transcriptional regulator McbR [Gimesia algae]